MQRTFVRITLLAFVLVIGLPPACGLAQQQTMLQGRVVDSANGQPLIGAQISVLGTDRGSVTDVDGRYRVDVSPGTYDLEITYLGYATKKVTGVQVARDRQNIQNVSLSSEAVQAEGITVVISSQEETGSIAGALQYQRNATAVVNGISSEEIGRTPSSNAADAARRVVSTSIMDGKYVFVRGLGERYSTARLDGSTLPSPEPEKRVLPLDIFPSNLIESLFTVKSYTADLPGDFAGGLVDIQTKDIPDQAFFKATVGGGYNTNFANQNFYTYPGGGSDWLGRDDGTRSLPSLPAQIVSTTPASEVAELHSRFKDGFSSRSENPTFGETNKSVAVSFGNRVHMLGRDGGYLAGVTYSNSADAREQKDAYPSQEADLIQYDYDSQVGERKVSFGAITGVSLDVTPTDRVSWKTIFTQNATDDARRITGPFDQSTSGFGLLTRLQYVERTLVSTKLSGKHKIDRWENASLSWESSYALARRHEPDTRQTSYVRQGDGPFVFNEAGNNTRFFSDLNDHMVQGGLSWRQQLSLVGLRTSLEAGASGSYRTRGFAARRFSYEGASSAARMLSPTELFTSERIAAGDIRFLDVTEPNDVYDADEKAGAGFLSLDLGLTPTLTLTTGVRVERNQTDVRSFDPRTGDRLGGLTAALHTTEPLPTVTLSWNSTPNQVWKLAAARTIVRPQFRELAPFRYDDYQESTFGNPFLKNGGIYNFDLRWSLFPASGEILSAGAFYKRFNDPIEVVRLPTVGSNVGSPEPYNASSARSYGVELEARQDLGRLADALSSLALSANVALADSRINQTDPVEVFLGSAASNGPDLLSPEVFTNASRPLYGQSPFLINAALYWSRADGATTATLLYNGVGERLTQVGTNNFDDIYEQPRHTLDLTVSQMLWNPAATLKVGVENLTNAAHEYRLGDFVTQRYEPGRQITLSLTSAL